MSITLARIYGVLHHTRIPLCTRVRVTPHVLNAIESNKLDGNHSTMLAETLLNTAVSQYLSSYQDP